MQENEVETTVQTDAPSENAGETTSRFKTPDELLKAYECLEKEFTKRSQKLKALEKELSEKAPSNVAYAQNDWQQKVDDFFESRPEIAPFKKEIAEEILKNDLGSNGKLELLPGPAHCFTADETIFILGSNRDAQRFLSL